jgi:hypothetical protein
MRTPGQEPRRYMRIAVRVKRPEEDHRGNCHGPDLPGLETWRVYAGRAALALGRPQEARELAEEQLRLLPHGPSRARGSAIRLLADVCDPDDRQRLLGEAVESFQYAGDLRCRKPVPPGRMLHWPLAVWPALHARAWDDLRLVGLKLVFLIVIRAVSLLGLSRRECWWKDAEILMLRHQLAVAERERPRAHSRLTWLDRARLALLAGTVP